MSKVPYLSRVVTLEDEHKRASQVRVNIFYERDIYDVQEEDDELSSTYSPPPKLEVEAYEDEVPSWSNEEIVVNETADADDCQPSTSNSHVRSIDPFYNNIQRKRKKVGVSNVLRFSSVNEMNEYCQQNQLDSSDCRVENWAVTDQFDPQKQFVFSVDEEYDAKSVEYVSQLSSVIREKNKNGLKVTCRVCGEEVSTQKKKQHIYVTHLRKPLYRCPLCQLSNLYHKANVEIHIKRRHGVAMKPIILKGEYQTQIDSLLYTCFNDKRILKGIDPEVTATVFDLLDWTVDGRTEPPPTPSSHTILVPDQISINNIDMQQMPDDLLEPDGTEVVDRVEEPFPKPKVQNVCGLCGMVNIRHLERHVLQHHVQLPMYLCPFCRYSSTYAINSVKDHIRVKHSISDHAHPIDLRDDNWSHISEMYELCFSAQANRTLKKKN